MSTIANTGNAEPNTSRWKAEENLNKAIQLAKEREENGKYPKEEMVSTEYQIALDWLGILYGAQKQYFWAHY